MNSNLLNNTSMNTDNLLYTILCDTSKYFTLEEFRFVYASLGINIGSIISQVLSPLQLSTITVGGKLSNIYFNEEAHCRLFKPQGDVICVACNFYEAMLKKNGTIDHQIWEKGKQYPPFPIEPIFYTDYKKRESERLRINKIRGEYIYPCLIPVRNSNRGRKKQPKKKSKRKVHGSGRCFNSSVQTTIKGIDPNLPLKYYFTKIYRNGSFTIPGSRHPDLSDVDHVLEILCTYFENIMKQIHINNHGGPYTDSLAYCMERFFIPKDIVILISQYLEPELKPVSVNSKYVIMQNYKCFLIFNNAYLNIPELINVLYDEKTESDAISRKYNIRIAEIAYTADRHAGAAIKFWRNGDDSNKKTTMKVLQSGKINYDGAIDFLEVHNLHLWFNEVIIENYREIVQDYYTLLEASDSSDTDISEYEYIYENSYIHVYENSDSEHNDPEYDYICKSIKEKILDDK